MTTATLAPDVAFAGTYPEPGVGSAVAVWRSRPLKQRLLWPLVRWWTRHDLPNHGRFLVGWGINDQASWQGTGFLETRETDFGFRFRADLGDFYSRLAYFMGHYHERHLMRLLSLVLRKGDFFFDGGANTGLMSMHAAGLVGPTGRVMCFEPNPVCLSSLTWAIRANDLRQMQVFPVGLSDAEETLVFRQPDATNLGSGTLGALPDRYGGQSVVNQEVRTVRGDDYVPATLGRPMVMKLDVEGFEVRALNGMERTMDAHKPLVITEVNQEMLAVNGYSRGDLWNWFASRGYSAYAVELFGWRKRLGVALHPMELEDLDRVWDVIWAHPDWPGIDRLSPLLAPPKAGAAPQGRR